MAKINLKKNKLDNIYTDEFYKFLKDKSYESAKSIVPYLIDIINPKSVVDVGCGVGAFLSVFYEHGIKDILGIDGNYVNKNQLLIPNENFYPYDLNNALNIKRKFDLVISLEVAEHLADDIADRFISDLISLGDIIFFSAAIPGQGGTHHVNERWQSYWVNKFEDHGFVCVDCIRNKFWLNSSIEEWYLQNGFIFCSKTILEKLETLSILFNRNHISLPFDIVHPRLFLRSNDKTFKSVLILLPVLFWKAMTRNVKKILS